MRLLYLLSFLSALPSLSQGQALPYSTLNSLYAQDFNSLPLANPGLFTGKGPFQLDLPPIAASSLQGWQMYQRSGTQANLQFGTSTGSATGSGIYSYGPNNQPNRSLGSLASGTGIYGFGLLLTNETGQIINQISLSFTAMQWRKGGSGNRNQWTFGFRTGSFQSIKTDSLLKPLPALDLLSIHHTQGASTLNGHVAANQQFLQATIQDLIWLPGQQLILRWDDADETGSDDAMSIDDFSFSGQQVLGPPVIQYPQIDQLLSTSARLTTFINEQLSPAFIHFEVDESPLFTHPNIYFPKGNESLPAGSGLTKVDLHITDLQPATNYYFRTKAWNDIDTSYSMVTAFTTPEALPSISLTMPPNNRTTLSAIIQITDRFQSVTEKGLVYSTQPIPGNNDQLIISSNQLITDTFQLDQLSPGTHYYLRAYAINQGGTAWSEQHEFITPSFIQSFTPLQASPSNQDTIRYQIITAHPARLTLANLSLQTTGMGNFTLLDLNSIAPNRFVLSILCKEANGSITPVIDNLTHQLPILFETPVTGPTTMVDQHSPSIRSISLPSGSFISGDTCIILLHHAPDSSHWQFQQLQINHTPLYFKEKYNDSTIAIYLHIKENTPAIYPNDSIHLSISITDPAGNKNSPTTYLFTQHQLQIDTDKPKILQVQLPEPGTYNSVEKLTFTLFMSERIRLDTTAGAPMFPITIGTRIRHALLIASNDSSLSFQYRIQPDELDTDGIRIHPNISLNQSKITDIAGNELINTLPHHGTIASITVDAVAPFVQQVLTPPGRTYGINEQLIFTVSFSKPVFIKGPPPFISINMPDQNRIATLVSGNGSNQLLFVYTVGKNDLIKQGFSVQPMIHTNGATIEDSSGNPALLSLRNIAALSNIRIDGQSPLFTQDRSRFFTCSNTSKIALQSILDITDIEVGEQIQWSLSVAPLHGSLQGLPFSKRLTSSNHRPNDLVYTPHHSFTGLDSFAVIVSDGVNQTSSWFYAIIEAPIKNNRIGNDTIICAGISQIPLKGTKPESTASHLRYHWQASPTESFSQFTTIHSGSNQTDVVSPPLLNNHFFRRIIQSDGCSDTSNLVRVSVRTAGIWIGPRMGNWHNPANWCGALIPDKQTDVLIQHDSVVANGSITCKSIQVNKDAQLFITGSLHSFGQLIGHQNMHAQQATIITDGPAPISLHPSVFHQQKINNLIIGNDTRLEKDSLFISGHALIKRGTLQTNDLLVLQNGAVIGSNAYNTKWEGMARSSYTMGLRLPSIAFHPFKETLQQNTTTAKTSYSYEGVALQGYSYFQWRNDSLLWKPGMAAPLTWPSQSTMVTDHIINPEKKYPTLSTGFRKIYDIMGTPFHGAAELNVEPITDTCFYLTGNPYLSPINLQTSEKTDNIGHYYWRWIDTIGEHGIFLPTPFTATGIISPYEAFIIKLNGQPPYHLNLFEESKVIAPQQESVSRIDHQYQISIGLFKNDRLLDIFQLLNSDTARHGYDAMDADKLLNPGSNIYSIGAQARKFAIDHRPFSQSLHLPLGIWVKDTGTYDIRVLHADLPSGYQLELADQVNQNYIKLKKDSSLLIKAGWDTSLDLHGRWYIRTPLPPPRPVHPISVRLWPNPASTQLSIQFEAWDAGPVMVVIRDQQGRTVKIRKLEHAQKETLLFSIADLRPGQYLAEIRCGQQYTGQLFFKL